MPGPMGCRWLELATCRRRIKKLYFLGQTLNGRFAFSAAISDPRAERFLRDESRRGCEGGRRLLSQNVLFPNVVRR